MQELQRTALPSIPGKTFARVQLHKLKLDIHARRIRVQSRSTQDHSTIVPKHPSPNNLSRNRWIVMHVWDSDEEVQCIGWNKR